MGIRDWFGRRKQRGPKQVGISTGGSRLLKYGGGEWSRSPIGFTEESTLELVELREKVYEELFGKSDTVFHEVIRLVPHVDVYKFQPTTARDFFTFVTGGMSDLAMASPQEKDGFGRATIGHGVSPVDPSAVVVGKVGKPPE